MILALPLSSLAVGLLLGHWMGRGRHWRAFALLILAVTAVFFWGVLTLRAQEGTGFDGVGEAALLVLGLIPLEIGALVGAGIAVIRNRRGRHG